jgi:predicted RNA-binding protein with RPS1 domain
MKKINDWIKSNGQRDYLFDISHLMSVNRSLEQKIHLCDDKKKIIFSLKKTSGCFFYSPRKSKLNEY